VAATRLSSWSRFSSSARCCYSASWSAPRQSRSSAGAFLIGKAVLNILAPEGGTVYRRSVIGYALGGIYAVIGIIAAHFLT